MNQYKKTMEKITISPEAEERILKSVSIRMAANPKVKKTVYMQWMRPMGAFAACFILIAAFFAIYSANNNPNLPSAPMPFVIGTNPNVNVQSIEELKKNAAFELMLPTDFPNGFKVEETTLIRGMVAEVIYSKENDVIVFRTSAGSGDVSGDYNHYPESNVVKIGSADVTLKGTNSAVSLATWTQDGCSFSLSFSTGVSQESVSSLISSLKKV